MNYFNLFKISISYIPLVSSPTPGENEEDPWADKTAEISFGSSGVRNVEGSSTAEAEVNATDSSDEEDNEPAPDKMEVDNDQDRK